MASAYDHLKRALTDTTIKQVGACSQGVDLSKGLDQELLVSLRVGCKCMGVHANPKAAAGL